jgi:hypothetical protein
MALTCEDVRFANYRFKSAILLVFARAVILFD